MQRWNEQQRQELRELRKDFEMIDKVNKYVGIIFVALCIVRGTVVKGWKFWQEDWWEWSYVSFLEGVMFVVSLITVMIKDHILIIAPRNPPLTIQD